MVSNTIKINVESHKLSCPLPGVVSARALLAVILVLLASASSSSGGGCYQSIICFGDSMEDTGNVVLNHRRHPESLDPPYGRTFFHHPTGRYSDGRLVVDFIAESLGLPYLRPYLFGEDGRNNFSKGVNLAVVGATALDNRIYEEMGIVNDMTNVSLSTQMGWLKQLLATMPDSRKYLENALIVMAIGGNDYDHQFDNMVDVEAVRPFVSSVVNFIGSNTKELIKRGAKTIMFLGLSPNGCLPIYLTRFWGRGTTENYYDPITGCLDNLNKFCEYHNEMLKKELNEIRKIYPHVDLIYADYYNAMYRFYLSPDEFGFEKATMLKACCGVGGPFNYNQSMLCGGTKLATSCVDPSSSPNWDGIHTTESANRLIAQAFLQGPFTTPDLRAICPSISKGPPYGVYSF